MYDEFDDAKLVKKTLKGDRKAFDMIIQRHQHSLYNYIGRMITDRELALDFTQDVFLKAYASLKTYRPLFKFSTWLYRIASNSIIDYWRKKKLPVVSIDQPVDPDEDGTCIQVPDDKPSVIRNFEVSELGKRLEKALDKLPVQLRELFVWRHINGLSYEEMAEIKKMPVGTVKNRVFQAKEQMRRILEETA
jgi:RNA polymerase sigma-70 factor (ECF subfamily)